MTHHASTLNLITRKALLGDENEKRIAEEHGGYVAQMRAKRAAREQGKCPCSRGGVICAKRLSEAERKEGPLCWPCFSNKAAGRPCGHSDVEVRP